MESRFSKYKTNNTDNGGKEVSKQIANINNYIDWNFEHGLDIVEKEIQCLQRYIDGGNAPKMFPIKKELLIKFGEQIEQLHEAYHFNRESNIN